MPGPDPPAAPPHAVTIPATDHAAILDCITDAIYALDTNWHFVYLNPQAEVLLRCPRTALLGACLWEAVPATAGRDFEERCRQALATGEAVTFETSDMPLGGWVEVRAYPSVAGLTILCHDITARKAGETALVDSARRDRLLVEQAADGFLIADEPGDVLDVNARLCAMLGYAREEMLGRPLIDFIDPDDLAARPLRRAELLAGQVLLAERRWRRRDDTTLPVETNSRLLEDRRVQVIVRDITARVRAEAALAASEERYRLLLEQASDGIIVIGQDGRFVEVNARACAMFGYEREELLGLTSRAVIAPEDLADRPMADPTGTTSFLDERLLRRKDGTLFPGEASVARLPNGQTQAIVRDVSERKRLEAGLAHQAYHDALTNLPNRARFLDRLDQALARASRRGNICAVLFLDLDRFKAVNDHLGHAAGDQLLVAVAARLGGVLRQTDTLARFGGDEFALLLEDIADLGEALHVAERLLAALAVPIPVAGRDLLVTTSIGLALSTTPEDTPADLLRFADVALYRAKEAGRACYEVFYPGMNHQALARLTLEHDLREALERGDFVVHYQPTVALATGAVTGLEALVRWQHPQRGLVPPGDFLAVAEETGLIVPIGRWVLGEACRQLLAWQARYPDVAAPVVAVNLSPRQFRHPDLAGDVAATLAETGLAAHLLRLEINETSAMAQPEATLAALQALRALGLGLALDNFGTGYSSLACLQQLPVDALKIDRSFFQDGARNRAIVRAATDLAHGLGLDVTAEGLETVAQVAWAREVGCDQGQGYYFGHPLPPEELAALWAAGLVCTAPIAGLPIGDMPTAASLNARD